MKRAYIKPETDAVIINVDKAYLDSVGVNGGSLEGKYEDAAEGNKGFIDNSDFADEITVQAPNLWDE